MYFNASVCILRRRESKACRWEPNTFLHIFTWMSKARSLKERPHELQGRRLEGPPRVCMFVCVEEEEKVEESGGVMEVYSS